MERAVQDAGGWGGGKKTPEKERCGGPTFLPPKSAKDTEVAIWVLDSASYQ